MTGPIISVDKLMMTLFVMMVVMKALCIYNMLSIKWESEKNP